VAPFDERRRSRWGLPGVPWAPSRPRARVVLPLRDGPAMPTTSGRTQPQDGDKVKVGGPPSMVVDTSVWCGEVRRRRREGKGHSVVQPNSVLAGRERTGSKLSPERNKAKKKGQLCFSNFASLPSQAVVELEFSSKARMFKLGPLSLGHCFTTEAVPRAR